MNTTSKRTINGTLVCYFTPKALWAVTWLVLNGADFDLAVALLEVNWRDTDIYELPHEPRKTTLYYYL